MTEVTAERTRLNLESLIEDGVRFREVIDILASLSITIYYEPTLGYDEKHWKCIINDSGTGCRTHDSQHATFAQAFSAAMQHVMKRGDK